MILSVVVIADPAWLHELYTQRGTNVISAGGHPPETLTLIATRKIGQDVTIIASLCRIRWAANAVPGCKVSD